LGILTRVFGEDQKKVFQRMKDPPLDAGRVHYMGGHKAYPSPQWTEIYFYEDRFVLLNPNITVAFSKIKDIANSNEMKRDGGRLMLGLIALPLALSYLWKKNHIYTIVQYDDGIDIQNIVIDFEKNVNYAQALIYKKMLEHRIRTDSNNPKADLVKQDKTDSPF
jgi:hypothetical protein